MASRQVGQPPRIVPASKLRLAGSLHQPLQGEGIDSLILPLRNRDLNAHLERFYSSLRRECLSRMIFFGEASLRRARRSYLEHYHSQRNHLGLDNQIIDSGDEVGSAKGEVSCDEKLGGLLRYYYRNAA